jgi:single-stranded-DNA-specific exonuclease
MTSTEIPRPPWRLRRADSAHVRELAREHGLSPTTAAVLAARGITSHAAARAHLVPRLGALHDPSLFPHMRAATERLARAIRGGETILVHGDYDVDGVTGTTLLVRLLRLVGARAEWHIPNRFTDGYSFGPHSIVKARECGATLVISVDNGTSARETIAELAALGIDTIVTDHHEPPAFALPPAVAIVNPKLHGSTYPFRELCGGAVAFKLAWGLCQELSGATKVREDLREFLVDAMAYVAIATVCDVVPLVDENRVLAHHGLRVLESGRTAGLRALMKVAGLDANGQKLEADDVAFKIGPRINAAGRLGSAQAAVALLLEDDDARARVLASELDALNIERKQIESELVLAAVRAAEPFADAREHPVLVVAGQGWHQGVVGIAAARLATRFARPAIVIGLAGETGRGSARSVPGFDVLGALAGGAAHLVKYGGHEQAAGCDVRADAIDALRAAVCARAREMLAREALNAPALLIDGEIPFAHMNADLMREIDRLKPFGEQNERPLFLSCGLRLVEEPRALGADKTHLSLRLRSGAHELKAMAFGQARRAGELGMGRDVHAVFTPRWNTFRGETKLELEVLDFVTGARPELG